MKNAVGKTYEFSRAAVRNSAIASNNVIFTRHQSSLERTRENKNHQGNANLSLGIYNVKYPKGIEGKGYYEDEVEIIGTDVLKAIILTVHENKEGGDDKVMSNGNNGGGREMLRPRNMALLSPHVFWSLWFYAPFAYSVMSFNYDNGQQPGAVYSNFHGKF